VNGLSGGTITSALPIGRGYLKTGSPSTGYSSGDIASTDDIVADDILHAGAVVQVYHGKIGAYINGSATIPQASSNGDVLAADDFLAGDDVLARGTKSAVVQTAGFGARRFYSDESTEVSLFDRGQGRLINGEAVITLDPIFLASVSISVGNPMLVQVTLTSDCNGVYVSETTGTGFTVKELRNGTSNATFNWEVACKRRSYENVRLEMVDIVITPADRD
jgi:hypothetical protein